MAMEGLYPERQLGAFTRSARGPLAIVALTLFASANCGPTGSPSNGNGNDNVSVNENVSGNDNNTANDNGAANDNQGTASTFDWKDPGMVPWIEPGVMAVYGGRLYAAVYYFDEEGPRLSVFQNDAWTVATGAPNDDVNALGVAGGRLYAGGTFVVPGVPNDGHGLIAYDSSGRAEVFTPGIGGDDFVAIYAITEHQGQAVIAGHFPTFGTVGVQHICMLNGSVPQVLDGGINGGARVDALLSHDGALFVAGTFVAVGTASLPAANIAEWDGTAWSAMGSGVDSWVRALAAFQGQVVAGGTFETAGGVAVAGLAIWNGSAWAAFPGGGVYLDLGATESGNISALRVYNGDLIVAGQFSRAGTVPANNIARFDGRAWHALGNGLNHMSGAGVVDVVEFNGDLIVTGFFDSPRGLATPDIAVWGPLP